MAHAFDVGLSIPRGAAADLSNAAAQDVLERKADLKALPASYVAHVAGNSIMADGKNPVNVLASRYTGGRISIGSNVAVAGQRSDKIPAQITSLADSGMSADAVVFSEGPNDASASVTLAQHIANYTEIIGLIRDNGWVPVVIACPPSDVSGRIALQNQYNIAERFLSERLGATCYDPWQRWTDTDGSWTSGASSDTVHPTAAVYYSAGVDAASIASGGLIDHIQPKSNAGQGLFTSNALMLTDTGADGIPDGWTASALTAPVYAIADADFPIAGNKWTISVSQSSNGQVSREFSTGYSIGDTICITGWLGLSGSTNMSVEVFLRFFGPSVDKVALTITGDAALQPFSLRAIVPASTTKIQVFARARTATTGAFSGDMILAGIDVYNLTTMGVA